MVKGKNAKELVGLAHTNMLTALGNADANDVNLCYGLINNLFQILKLEDFYTELEQVQGGGTPVGSCGTPPLPANVIPFPVQPSPDVVNTATDGGSVTEAEAEVTQSRTKDEVRALLVKVSQANKDLKSLLSKYGATKFSDLDEKTYDAIYADAEALMSEV